MSGKSMFSKFTIMIPPPRPDQDFSREKRELKERIKNKGLKNTVVAMVEDYYRWEDDPNPVSAWKKRRAVLIFSKKELEAIIPNEIHSIVGSFEFLLEESKTPARR